MKKIITLLIAVIFTAVSFAQLQGHPTGKPGKPELPTPKIPPITKPDLQITELRVISATTDRATKQHIIIVSVTIKNNGQLTAAPTKLRGFDEDIIASTAPWNAMGTADIGAINGGQSVTAEYTFVSALKALHTSPFYFKVVADANNAVTESNETNNTSAIITVTLH